MSEGPEVKRRAEELNAALAGETILSIEAHHKRLLAFLEKSPDPIIGHRINRVYSIGKHILFELDNGLYLHNHLLMFGSWRIYDAGVQVPHDERTMEVIGTESKQAVLRGGSVFEVLDAEGLRRHPSLSKLGPDVLGDGFDEDCALENFRKHPEEEIGVALLNQELISGVGNYLKSEILFATRTDPRRCVREFGDEELREIIRATRRITQASFESQGYTIPEELRGRLEETGMLPRTMGHRHWVFRRTNRPCWNCGTPIRQFRQGKGAGRITYVCPECQKTDC